MNKYNIAKYLIMKNSKYTLQQKKLLNDIEKAREELERCRIYFDFVKDPHLVDYAIYMEEAAKSKYMYLLNKVKKDGLKVKYEDVFPNLNRKSS
ncbi:DUF2508 family protein [Clostridium luticellarii]|jgi:hypothetical protein|uniref:DUF2508 domain-containing protein n=1 Tax=Clostridium luticellarii TaxID=1691940 RepID=A0A2T0BLX6_9CLOT|nr:DUF2508 family protein [Clostridium luticellarii]MCI1945918.1 YaaL family protein [Clostridium luticellarii]MCI1969280.1 YaaL family protein [Clostridium luticellarii]MCI1996204.1 YaaL family protein [Clostridium luticellarii]MCI2040583.1 YaaL family protein [Clostridium luticellarii]PRR84878.1 hypothetical protein CLLU_21470 [Clostridium luticellarii]